jgi:hypothetical protein
VNVAGWSVSRGAGVLEDPDGASGLFGGGYERYGVGAWDRSALARPDALSLLLAAPMRRGFLCTLTQR